MNVSSIAAVSAACVCMAAVQAAARAVRNGYYIDETPERRSKKNRSQYLYDRNDENKRKKVNQTQNGDTL